MDYLEIGNTPQIQTPPPTCETICQVQSCFTYGYIRGLERRNSYVCSCPRIASRGRKLITEVQMSLPCAILSPLDEYGIKRRVACCFTVFLVFAIALCCQNEPHDVVANYGLEAMTGLSVPSRGVIVFSEISSLYTVTGLSAIFLYGAKTKRRPRAWCGFCILSVPGLEVNSSPLSISPPTRPPLEPSGCAIFSEETPVIGSMTGGQALIVSDGGEGDANGGERDLAGRGREEGGKKGLDGGEGEADGGERKGSPSTQWAIGPPGNSR